MKKITAIILCWLLVINIGVLFVFAKEEFDWGDGSCIIATVKTSIETNFDPQDFPEIECSAVYVLEKLIVGESYYYTLILDVPESSDVKELLSVLLENPLIISASENHYKDAYSKSIKIQLSEEVVYVSLGGKTEIFVENYYWNAGPYRWKGIAFSVDPNVIDEDSFTKDMFSAQGILHFWPHIDDDEYGVSILYNKPAELEATKSEKHLYYGQVDESGNFIFDPTYVNAVDALSCLEGIESVYLLDSIIVGGAPIPVDVLYYNEHWQCDNAEIASVYTYGGTKDEYTGYIYNKTAVISGVAEGETYVTVIRKGESGWVKQMCKVCIFTPCDMNGDGICNNLEATAMLKYDAGLAELPEGDTDDFDLNSDGKVNNIDAVMILKYDAGLI